MSPEFIAALDNKISELNVRPELQLDRVFSIVRRLEDHLQGIDLCFGQLQHLIDELFFYVVVIPIPIPLSEKMSFTRAVKYEEGHGVGYESVQRLSYIHPDSDVPRKIGRMNREGESMFYANKDNGPNSIGVVLSEMRARPGEIYNMLFSETVSPQLAEKRSDEVMYIVPLGVFDYYRRGLHDPFGLHQDFRECYEYLLKGTSSAGMLAMQLVDAFLTDLLKRKGSELLYSLTSLLSTQFSSNALIDGMLYPSTQFDGSPNVALKITSVDRKLKHKGALSIHVLERYGFGIFKTETIGIGNIVDETITWEMPSIRID